MSTALTTSERNDLDTLEEVVAAGIDTFVEVGRALAEIRDRGLYREAHDTFEGYCRERWELGRTRAYQLISASAVNGVMSTMVDTPPTNERQARELAPLLQQDEQEAVQVWRELTTRHGDGLTAAKVRQAVDEKLHAEKTVQCPDCQRMVRVAAGHKCPARKIEEPDMSDITGYSIDSKRKGQLARSAAERFWKMVVARGGLPSGSKPLHELLHLERALAILTDEEIADAITSLENGIAETRAVVDELRRHQGRS